MLRFSSVRATNLIGVVFAFFPLIALTFVYHLLPPASAIFAGFIMQASVSGVFWFVEPISYSPVLGIAGTYMSFLSGNIGNLRLPASVAALQAAGEKPGTEKGSIIATIGIAISIIVNVLMLTVGVILGSSILGALPESVVLALNNILPALFGAMLAQQFVANPKIGSIAVVLAGGMFALYRLGFLSFLPGTPTYAIIIVSVFGTILIGRKVTKTAALTGDDET
ncbi:MAG TPA: hypothetical protein IAA51_14985 [Candidatus Cottocaccamicrobium excrementipullorum]|nr:hypothetical protein [Candidatus Cottocaccamicrobium excrementipullorum]